MHLQWREAGAMGTNAIVGGAVPQAAGFAWSDKHAGTDAVSVTYFGDGAVNIGSVLETFNLAAAWKLPVCFFIENNHYAVSTTPRKPPVSLGCPHADLGFGIPSWRVDGMDPVAVHLAMERGASRTCGLAGAPPSSRPTSTATSTRTAPSRAAHSAIGEGRGAGVA